MKTIQLERQPRNICILRLSALGDATHVVPVVRALQSHWLGTSISWIIGKPEHRLLGGLQGVEFIVFNKGGGRAAIRDLRRQLKGREFGLLLHMQVALRANILSRLVRTPLRLGWNHERSRDRHQWFINRQVAHVSFQHQVQGFLEFPRALGIEVDSPRWDLPVSEEDRAWAETHIPGSQPLLVINPCSRHVQRNWRVENYAKVADYAASGLGMRVVIAGGPSELEKQAGAGIESAMQHPAINLVAEDTLTQSMAVLKKAAVVISPDSGPVHIASALGTPVIGLYAATWSRRSGPYNSLDLCVDRFAEAARKFRNKEAEELRWGTRIEVPGVMDLVSVEAVCDKLDSLIPTAHAV